MNFYEELPTEILVQFFNEVSKNIEKGILTKTMYYELGLIISVANRRGIDLEKPADYKQIVDPKLFSKLMNENYAYAV